MYVLLFICSYKVIRELKLPTFQRIIKQNKFELIRIAKRRPDRVSYIIFIQNRSN